MKPYDVIVVGAGPGGATAATLLSMQGYSVALLDRESLPAYKIGESLLPATVNGICALLGVTEELRAANFVIKRGGTFRWGKSRQAWTFSFAWSPKMRGPTSFAYQVERMKFDAILVNNAKKKGVDVFERHTAMSLQLDNTGRAVGLVLRDPSGSALEVRAGYVVDASGWQSTLAKAVGQRIYSEVFKNVAVYGYFAGGGRLPEPNAGNIFCAAFERGWFWYIPLSPDLTSVGAVIDSRHASMLRGSPRTALTDLIAECDEISALLGSALYHSEAPYDQVRVRSDYSYCNSKFWRPGLVLIGDAACFIDPVFSSGVHLATYSGLLAARSINTYFRGRTNEEKAFSEFDRRYRREFSLFHDFLVAFYNVEQDVDSYYWSARRLLDHEGAASQAFVELVGGVGSSGEMLVAGRPAAKPEELFPEASGTAAAFGVKHEGERFVTTLMGEQASVQALAAGLDRRGFPSQLFRDGLTVSEDGMQWCEPGL